MNLLEISYTGSERKQLEFMLWGGSTPNPRWGSAPDPGSRHMLITVCLMFNCWNICIQDTICPCLWIFLLFPTKWPKNASFWAYIRSFLGDKLSKLQKFIVILKGFWALYPMAASKCAKNLVWKDITQKQWKKKKHQKHSFLLFLGG